MPLEISLFMDGFKTFSIRDEKVIRAERISKDCLTLSWHMLPFSSLLNTNSSALVENQSDEVEPCDFMVKLNSLDTYRHLIN